MNLFCACLLMLRDFARLESLCHRYDSLDPGANWPSQWALASPVASGWQPVIRGLPESGSVWKTAVEIPRVIFQYWDNSDVPAEV